MVWGQDGDKNKTIVGRVLYGDSTLAAYATVSLVQTNKVLSTKICDSLGTFSFYNIQLSSAPLKLVATYLNDSSAFFLISKDQNAYVLKVKHRHFDSLLVSSSKKFIEQKADRTIYNIGDNPAFQNQSITDILKMIPRVQVSDKNIAIIGKGKVGVLLNDRLLYLDGRELMAYLSIFQNDIESIEIIPNPPAKYDADGSGGLINIVLKKNKALGYAINLQSTITKNTFWQSDNNLSIRLKKKNYSISSGLNIYKGSSKEIAINEYKFSNGLGWQNFRDNKADATNFSSNISAELYLNTSTILSTSYSFSKVNFADTYRETFSYSNNELIDSITLNNGLSNSPLITHAVNFSIDKKLKRKGAKVSYSFDFVNFDRNQNQQIDGINYLINAHSTGVTQNVISFGNSQKQLISSSLDLTNPASFLGYNLKTGLKYSVIDNNSQIGFDKLINKSSIFLGSNIVLNDLFFYNEKNFSAYISGDKKYKRLSVNYGIRAEFTKTTAISQSNLLPVSNKFQYFFPSIFYLYEVNKNFSLSLSYSKRINRPYVWDINPYRKYTSLYSYSEGNPYLQPSIQHNTEFTIVFKGATIFNVFYNISKDPIVSLSFSNNGIVDSKKVNNGTLQSYGTSVETTQKLANWLSSNISFAFSISNFKSDYNYDLSKSPLNCNYYWYNLIKLTKKLRSSITLNGALPSASNGYMSQDGYYQVNLGFRGTLVKDNLDITVSIQDIFKSSRPFYYMNTNLFTSSSYNYYDARSIKIGFKYKFGKQQISGIDDRSKASNEKSRL